MRVHLSLPSASIHATPTTGKKREYRVPARALEKEDSDEASPYYTDRLESSSDPVVLFYSAAVFLEKFRIKRYVATVAWNNRKRKHIAFVGIAGLMQYGRPRKA
jgi:hypothetical protein